jgi:hypothetical protein
MKNKNAIAEELRKNTVAVRVQFSRLNNSKTLKAEEKAKAAAPFHANKKRLSASKKLFDVKHPAIANAKAILGQVKDYWSCHTLPYTEDSVRLLHRGKLAQFDADMKEFADKVNVAGAFMDECRAEILQQAKDELADLFDPGDYPQVLSAEIGFEWDFPSIEPPEYLCTLAPQVYKQEQDKIQARLNEAVAMAETAFLTEFEKLVEHLHERLTPSSDGSKKIFRDSAVTNMVEFFDKFKAMNLGSNDDLEKLINEAQELMYGVTPGELRTIDTLKADIGTGMAKIKDKLSELVTTAPRRNIIKPTLQFKEAAHETAQSKEAVPA